MTLDRRDIEEVGEAVEALGIMVEEELKTINQHLASFYSLITQTKEEDRSFQEEWLELKKEVIKIQETIKGLENILTRTEKKLIDLQEGISTEEDFTEEIKNDLLIIKRELQLLRSDFKEYMEQQSCQNKNLEN